MREDTRMREGRRSIWKSDVELPFCYERHLSNKVAFVNQNPLKGTSRRWNQLTLFRRSEEAWIWGPPSVGGTKYYWHNSLPRVEPCIFLQGEKKKGEKNSECTKECCHFDLEAGTALLQNSGTRRCWRSDWMLWRKRGSAVCWKVI